MSVISSPSLTRARVGAWPIGLSYLLLYLPAGLAWLLVGSPVASFALAWLGSWWILGLSTMGKIRPLPGDRSAEYQLFRPLFVVQFIFAGYFCLGSIFHVWDLLSLSPRNYMPGELQRTAAAQRYLVLGHAAFVHGLLVTMDYRRSGEWSFQVRMSREMWFLVGGGGAFVLSFLCGQIPGLGQFATKLQMIALVAVIISLGYAIREGSRTVATVSGALYGVLLIGAFLSGWKHQVILAVVPLLFVLYPRYKRKVIVAGGVLAILFVTVLPAYNAVFRNLSWQRQADAQQAASEAFEKVTEGRINIEEVSWSFLSERLTLIELFTDYIEHTPQENPFYGFAIVKQGMQSIIPRVLWPSKPNTEKLAMKRVYENQVVAQYSDVSAKPLVIIDGYLSSGAFGVFLTCFLFGGVASIASKYAEIWFGGYSGGGQVIFTSLFGWPLFTPSFEFLFNTVFWSFVLMALLAVGLRFLGILQRGSASAFR